MAHAHTLIKNRVSRILQESRVDTQSWLSWPSWPSWHAKKQVGQVGTKLAAKLAQVGNEVGTRFCQVGTKNGQVGSEVGTLLQHRTSFDSFFNLSVSLAGYFMFMNVIATWFSKHTPDRVGFCEFLPC